jgi:hypothetical protein
VITLKIQNLSKALGRETTIQAKKAFKVNKHSLQEREQKKNLAGVAPRRMRQCTERINGTSILHIAAK